MAVTWNSGDTTTITVPQAFADLSGSASSGQFPTGVLMTPSGVTTAGNKSPTIVAVYDATAQSATLTAVSLISSFQMTGQ